MLEAYARSRGREQYGVTAHFYFIEQRADRIEALREELDKRKPVPDIDPHIIEGNYEDEFPRVVQQVTSDYGRQPIFAFIDPFGATPKPEHATTLVALPRCEVLIFVPIGYFADLFTAPDMRRTLKAVFGSDVFARGAACNSAEARRTLMVEMMEEKLKSSCQWVRAFELPPEPGSGRTHFLFFGTNNEVGLARMKDAMWKLDPIEGKCFRDSTAPQDSVLFEDEPNLLQLRRSLEARFDDRVFTIEEAADFTLFETPFRHDGHLKMGTLAPAEKEGRLVPVEPPAERRRSSYKDGTRYRFVSE
jgi:three-Cys-motif partner protein